MSNRTTMGYLRGFWLSGCWLLLASAVYGEDTIKSWHGTTMGPIEYHVQVVVDEDFDAEAASREVADVLESINQAMSTYQPESEVSRFNRESGLDWFPVSDATAEVVERSLEISRQTEGAFDITVKPIVERWNFGANKREFVMPTAEEREALRERTGYQKLTVRRNPPALKKSVADLEIDLSAIAKGYAVDCVAAKLAELGVDRYFVEVGGEVRVQGKKPDGVPWRVGIESPLDYTRQVQRVVATDGAVATSGDYRNFVMIEGRRYSHEIDPRTAEPTENALASVSVVAEDCMSADAWATAVMVLGRQEGMKLAAREGFHLLAIERDGTSFRETATADFPFFEPDAAEEGPAWLNAFMGAMVIFGLAVLAMALGAIFSNKPIQGSCGGISAKIDKDGASSCSLCEKPVTDCVERRPG